MCLLSEWAQVFWHSQLTGFNSILKLHTMNSLENGNHKKVENYKMKWDVQGNWFRFSFVSLWMYQLRHWEVTFTWQEKWTFLPSEECHLKWQPIWGNFKVKFLYSLRLYDIRSIISKVSLSQPRPGSKLPLLWRSLNQQLMQHKLSKVLPLFHITVALTWWLF